jgi:hypothetical protein
MCSFGRRVSRGMPIRLFWPLPTATNDEAASDAGRDGVAPPSHCSSGYPHVVAGRWSLVFVMTEGYRAGPANRPKSGDSPKPSSSIARRSNQRRAPLLRRSDQGAWTRVLSVRRAVFALSELCQTPCACAATSSVISLRRSSPRRAVRTPLAIMLQNRTRRTRRDTLWSWPRGADVAAAGGPLPGWHSPAIVKRCQGAITMFD